MSFSADLAKPVTVGVAGLADAGILFPAVSEGIPFPTDSVEFLFPADHVELCAVGVTDLDELSELGTFAGTTWKMQSSPCCYEGDGVDFWDPVIMASWDAAWMNFQFIMVVICGFPDGSDFGYSDCYDDQSELSDYEDPRDFFRDEWLDSCEFHAPDGSYFSVSEVGEASSPVSGYTAGTDVEVSVTPVKLQQDLGDASISAVYNTSGPVVDFLDPPPPAVGAPRSYEPRSVRRTAGR